MLNINDIERSISQILIDNKITQHQISYQDNNQRLEICIAYNDGSMDINTCDKISQLISAKLDEIDENEDNYILDVCSFGAEKVLTNQQEILANINNYVHIDLFNPVNGLNNVEGYLLEYQQQAKISYMAKNIKKEMNIEKENIKLIRLAVKI